MSDYNGILHLEELVKEQSRDSYQWSRAIVAAVFQTSGVILDQKYMHCLIANAMMVMSDSIHNKEISVLKSQLEKAEALLNELPQLYELPIMASCRIVNYFKEQEGK